MNVAGLESVLSVIGVFAPGSTDEMTAIGNTRCNRLFCDKTFAHGLDIPLEALIFTESVNEGNGKDGTYSANDILQQSGRCGRPSKSNISVVYMSGATYEKCLRGNASDAITNLLLRYKYYNLEDGSVTINRPMLESSRYPETQVAGLLERMRGKFSF
jgi:hypothetical protein